MWLERHIYGGGASQPLPLQITDPYLNSIARGVSSPLPARRVEAPMHYLAFAFLALAATLYIVSHSAFGV